MESPKSWNSMGYISPKTTFLHLTQYLQSYLTLLSTNLWFGKWHEEYGKFFPGHPKNLKFTEELYIYHDNEELHKMWRGTDFSFQSWHGKLDEFWPSTRKSQKSSF